MLYRIIFTAAAAVIGYALGQHIDAKKSSETNSGTDIANAPIVPVQSVSEPPANAPDLDNPGDTPS